MALQLTRRRAPDDLATDGRSRRAAEDLMPGALGSRHLMLVRPIQQAIDRPAKIDISEILTAWRMAERALGVIPEGSPDRAIVHARLVSLRDSYHRLFAKRRDQPPAVRGFERLVEMLNSRHRSDGPIAASRASTRDTPAAPLVHRR